MQCGGCYFDLHVECVVPTHVIKSDEEAAEPFLNPLLQVQQVFLLLLKSLFPPFAQIVIFLPSFSSVDFTGTTPSRESNCQQCYTLSDFGEGVFIELC
jgi:hypothetical protein